MSELTIFSIGILIGNARKTIAKLIGEVCGADQPRLQEDYLATPEREALLHGLYVKNFTRLEEKYLSSALERSDKDLDHDQISQAQMSAIHFMSMAESISQVEPLAHVANAKHAGKMPKITSAIATMKEHLQNAASCNMDAVKSLTREYEPVLRKIAYDAHRSLANAEEQLSLTAVTNAMKVMDFKVKANGKNMVCAKGGLIIRASSDGGQVKLDTRSLGGISCHSEILKLEKVLAQEGMLLRRMLKDQDRSLTAPTKIEDPFPLLPEGNAHKNRESGKETGTIENQDVTAFTNNRHTNLLLRQHAQRQMDAARIGGNG